MLSLKACLLETSNVDVDAHDWGIITLDWNAHWLGLLADLRIGMFFFDWGVCVVHDVAADLLLETTTV